MDTRIEKIAKLYKEGISFNNIGLRLRISKTTVSNDVNKLIKSGEIKQRIIGKDKYKNTISMNIKRSLPENEKKSFDYPAPDNAVDIMNLKHNSCRFPFHGTLFCGKIKTPVSSYCKEHDELCVTMRTKTR